MTKAHRVLLWLCLLPVFVSTARAQEDASRLHVNVVLVQLSVAVTDQKGNYVSGLRPEDFTIVEDTIPEKMAFFEEGFEAKRRLMDTGPAAGGGVAQNTQGTAAGAPGATPATQPAAAVVSPIAESNVYILFDTSNYMYRGFVFAQDAVADFVRSLEGISKVALYSYSRNLSRVAPLTLDRSEILRGVRSTVAGDDAALYNALLLTVKDAAQVRGRKTIVVFSNGPDNASLVPPEDVAELAQSTGTIIYMISTQLAQAQPLSTAVFERISHVTGGKAYFSKDWQDEKQAFSSIRNDLAHLYALSYYPQPNQNQGWRNITVKLVGKDLQKYRIRTRNGYRLLRPTQVSNGSIGQEEGASASQ